MRTIVVISAFLTTLALAFSAAAADPKARCHGERATYVGSTGSDRVGYESRIWSDPRPVLVLLGGDDRVDVPTTEGMIICAGSGHDRLELMEGNPRGLSSAGETVFDGGAGDDGLQATGSTDALILPAMTLLGGPGDDRLRSANGADRLIGGGGDDVFAAEFGKDLLEGGSGDDSLRGQGDEDILRGGDGEDYLSGGGGSVTDGPTDRADGGPGTDDCGAEILRACEMTFPDIDE